MRAELNGGRGRPSTGAGAAGAGMLDRPTEPGPALRGVLEAVEDLEVLPVAARRILEVADDPSASLSAIERAVALDPALVTQLLRLANSSFYGLRRKVSSLERAIFVVGVRTTRTTALALAMLSLGRGARPGRSALWRHSMRTGAAARRIAAAVDGFDEREVFVSGLLHDMGKLLLLEVDERRCLPIFEEPGLTPAERLAAERALLGVDHAELGATCLAQWGLPEDTVEAVRRHHAVAEAEGPEIPLEDQDAALLCLADALAHRAAEPASLAESLVAATVGVDSGRLAEVASHLDDDVSQMVG